MVKSSVARVFSALGVLVVLWRCCGGGAEAAEGDAPVAVPAEAAPDRLATGYREGRWGQPLPAELPPGCVASGDGWLCDRRLGGAGPLVREGFHAPDGRFYGATVQGFNRADCLAWLHIMVAAYGPPAQADGKIPPPLDLASALPTYVYWQRGGAVALIRVEPRLRVAGPLCSALIQHEGEYARRKAAAEQEIKQATEQGASAL